MGFLSLALTIKASLSAESGGAGGANRRLIVPAALFMVSAEALLLSLHKESLLW